HETWRDPEPSPSRDRRRALCESPANRMEGQHVNRNKLLNAELAHAIASMGHGDLMIVCDAGFPIPSSAWRIDLSIVPDVPDLDTVLKPISESLIVERLSYADTLPEYNAPLLATVKRLFGEAEFAAVK